MRALFFLAVLAVVAACGRQEPLVTPGPAALTRDAIGHYCHMIVLNHKGPKGQIFLTENEAPMWFTSVRDTLAFTLLPGEPKNIAAIYVNDMSQTDWDAPAEDSWIDARKAIYVLDSERKGGMGAAEAVPFSSRDAAQTFIGIYGGRLAEFDSIPGDYILGEDASSHGG